MWFMDDTALKFARYEPTTGHRPEAENEIMADTKTLDALGIPAEIGATVTLDYKLKEFHIQRILYYADFGKQTA